MTLISKDDESNLLEKSQELILQRKTRILSFLKIIIKGSYGKVIQEVIDLCKKAGVLTAVDPKRKNFFSYRQVDIFKPNLKEVKEGLNLLVR